MKKLILTFLLISVPAYGETDAQCKARKECYCTYVGSVFQTAARDRDRGLTPKEAFSGAMGYSSVVEIKKIKAAINLVYFDDGFRYARGRALQMQMINVCMNGLVRIEPFK